MRRVEGTAARQLDLLDEEATTGARIASPGGQPRDPRASLHVLRRDIYAELARRRRRAQIKARKMLA